MEKFNKTHLENIQKIVCEKSGAAVMAGPIGGHRKKRLLLLTACFMCFAMLSAFAYMRFSGLNGDELSFAPAYLGDGRFEIVVVNHSNRELKLQNKVKVMQWSTGEDVKGDSKKIIITNQTIPAHSQEVVSLDISKGYNVKAMEEALPKGDWYYFVFTNYNFAFGHDWMCSFDFETKTVEEAQKGLAFRQEHNTRKEEAGDSGAEEAGYDITGLMASDWIWPTESQKVSDSYEASVNETDSERTIHIAGKAGNEVYAVAEGTVVEAAFDSACGNYIVLDLGNGVMVKYGYLKKIRVTEQEEVRQGQVIGTLGQTGMATGPNLMFTVITK